MAKAVQKAVLFNGSAIRCTGSQKHQEENAEGCQEVFFVHGGWFWCEEVREIKVYHKVPERVDFPKGWPY